MISGFTSDEAGRQAGQSLYGRPRSRWLAHLFALVVIGLTTSLGIWQLQRASEKAAAQAHQAEALARAPTLLDAATLDGLVAGPSAAADLDGRLVRVQGHFDAAHTVFLDNRTRQGVAGFHVLAPLKVAGGDQVVMVLRGWIARDPRDRTRLPTLRTPEGPVEVQGLAQRELAQPVVLGGRNGGERETARLWQHYEPDGFAAWSGLKPAPLLVRQTVEPAYRDELARDWNQPGTGVDRHRGYALQWFTMAALALAVWIGLSLRGRRPAGGSREHASDGTSEAADRTGGIPDRTGEAADSNAGLSRQATTEK